MYFRIVIFIILLYAGPPTLASHLYGLERMERFDLLPLIHEGTRVKQVSGFDRTNGNDDGFNGTYSSLYFDENDEYVMFDEIGAGCVYRFWMTYDHPVFGGPADYDQNILRFYYDNEAVPRLEISIDDFFDGVGAPFEFPMVGRWKQSSHGCYCYVPFPFKERLKVTLSRKPYFYNITYHRFDHGEDVTSWTGSEDQSFVMAQWNNVGAHPIPASEAHTNSVELFLGIGETGQVFSVENAGLIETIKIDLDSVNEDIIRNFWLNINFDGGDSEVHVPVGDFFGSGYGEIEISALPVGMKTNGYWYCHFPMPYWESANIQFINNSSVPVTIPVEVITATNTFIRAEAGYFNAKFNERTFVADGEDYNFIDELGRGHVVGVSLRMHGTGIGGWRGLTYLEGDERAYIDGARSPAIHGTGNEDYFNAGWYFDRGTFDRPYHGCTYRDHKKTGNTHTEAYRFHLSDTIPFYESINFRIEHGPQNNEPGTFSSIVYYYKQFDDGFGSGMRMVADLDLGDSWVENLYDYTTTGFFISNAWQYVGENEPVIDTGYSESNLTFRLPLIENAGVLLRRRIDLGAGQQKADVYVDDQLVGNWYEPDLNYTNSNLRWIDSEIMIPSSYLEGKESAVVRIQSTLTFPEDTNYDSKGIFHLWAYAIRPLINIADKDNDRIPDFWEIRTVGDLTTLGESDDLDLDGISDADEYLVGTNPNKKEQWVNIDPSDGIQIKTVPGRLYFLESSYDLKEEDWSSVIEALSGTGRWITLSDEFTAECKYFRLKVNLK